MKTILVGSHGASICLIQAADSSDGDSLKAEYDAICSRTKRQDILLAGVLVDSWNNDLSPWEAPPVFGDEPFGGGAEKTLSFIENEVLRRVKDNCLHDGADVRYIIGGYSLAALFALWACHKTDLFFGCAAASPSVWFPDFLPFATKNTLKANHVYLSLGDKEAKTKNSVMATVEDCIRELDNIYRASTWSQCTLEWNKGNHFKDADIRTAKAFAEVVGHLP